MLHEAWRKVSQINNRVMTQAKPLRAERDAAALWLASEGVRVMYKALGITRNSWVNKRRDQGDIPPARVPDAAEKLPKLALEVARLEERGRAAREARDVMMRNLTDVGRSTRELGQLSGRNRTLVGKRVRRVREREADSESKAV